MELTEVVERFEEYGQHYKVIRPVKKAMINDSEIREFEQEVFDHIEQEPGTQCLLDFKGTTHLLSLALNTLIRADQKNRCIHNRHIPISGLAPNVYEVFAITRLNKFFNIYNHYQDFRDSL